MVYMSHIRGFKKAFKNAPDEDQILSSNDVQSTPHTNTLVNNGNCQNLVEISNAQKVALTDEAE